MANDLKRGIRVYLETSDYGKGITDMVTATKKYEASLEQLTAESKRMTTEGKNSGKAWDDLQLKLKRTSEQVKRSQAAEADYTAKLKQTEKVLNNLSGSSYNELIAVQKQLKSELRNTTRGTDEQIIRLQQLERVNHEVSLAQGEMNSSIGSGGKGIKGFINNLTDIPGPVGMAASSVKGFGTALKLLLLNPVGLALAVIVATLLLLKSAFLATDTGAVAFAGVLKGLGNVLDILLDRTMSYFKLLFSIATFDMEGIKRNGTEAFGGIAASIKDAAAAGYEYERVMDSIADRESASLIRAAKLRAEIEKLKNQAKDANRPLEERLKLNNLAMQKEKELMSIEKGFMKERNKGELDNLAAKIQVAGMSKLQKQQQIEEWLKLDDRQIEQYAKNNARFREFVDKNETEFQALQKLKSDEFNKDAEFESGTRRLQKDGVSFRVDLQKQADDKVKELKEKAAKKAEDDEKKKLENLATSLLKQQNDLKESLSNNTKTQSEYDTALIALQREFLTNKQKLYKVGSKEYEDVRAQMNDLELKDQAEYDALILKALEKSHQSKISATNEWEKIEKQKLLDNFTTKVKFESDSLALEQTVAERRLEDAKAYALQVSMFTYATEEEKVNATKSANDAIVNAELALATATKSIAQKKLDDEKEFQAKKKSFRDQFGLDDITSIKGQYQKELAELKKGLEEKLLTEKEYTSKKRELGAKTGAKYAQEAVQYVGAAADAISAYHQMETDSLKAEKQKQLSAAGNNAEARQKIEEDFAQKELDLRKKQSSANMAISIAQAIANGALAIMNIWATTGINPIAAGILTAFMVGTTAMQVGSIVAQNAAIQSTTLDSSAGGAGGAAGGASTGARVVSQAADGRWDVMGADDGRTYRNVPYGGVARTGIGSTPTLMFERGDELIVDNPTLRNLRMNAPYVLDAIRKNRVSQRADGNYSQLGSSGGSGSGSAPADNSTFLASVIERNSNLLEYLATNRIEAYTLLSDFEKKRDLRDKSLAKGSLK